jgi:Leucine-rich repeat (LRR) protein
VYRQSLILCLGLLWTAAAFADDRAVAEWVIRQGGRVVLTSSPQPVADLAGLPASVVITGVDLYGTIIEPKELEQLSGLQQIKELYLPGPSWNPGAGSRLDANEELKFLAPLRTLEKLHFSLHFLTNVNVQDKGMQHLSALTNLKEIRLAQGRVKNFSFAVFPNLEGLDLSYSTATDDVLKSLSGLKHLRRLNLRDTLVTDEGLAHLATVTTLEEIDLYGVKISDRGLAHLKNLRELRKLNLLGGPIADVGAEILSGLPKLRDLNLYRAELTNAGVAKLSALRELAFLDLRYTRATAAGVEKLRSALPNCKIDFTGGVGSLATKTVAPAPAAGAPESSIAKWIRDSLRGRVEVRADGRVRSVSLARTGVTDSLLAPVARLSALEELDLEATEIGDLGLATLARCVTLKRLKLDSTTVSDRGLAHLAGLRQLESLSLAGTLVRTLAPLPATLRTLDLSSTNAGLDAMKQVVALRNLVRVDLAYTDLSNPASQDLLGELVPSIRILDLTGADIEDRGIAAIAKLTGLEELLVNHGRFTEKGFASLATLVNLRRLEAVRTRITAASAGTLKSFGKLERLNLDYTTFNDEALKAISSLPLRELRLDSANITDAGVASLSTMKSLKLVNLYHTLVSEEAHGRLVQALPDTKIIWDRDSKLPNRRGS